MKCEWCEQNLPAGCRHMHDQDKGCPLTPRMDTSWLVGMAIWRDLSDRRGIKQELAMCDIDIQPEIVDSLGNTAIKAYEAKR